MAENILVVDADDARAQATAASSAQRFGDTLGLVHTCLAPGEVRKVGSRIEEERTFGGAEVSAFDEPLGVGSAVAQLAGFADAVIVERLDDWALRLFEHYGEKEDRILEEIAGVTTIMTADLAELVFISRPPEGEGPVAELHRRILEAMAPHVTEQLGS